MAERLAPPPGYRPVPQDDLHLGYQAGAVNPHRGSLRELNFWHSFIGQHGEEYTRPRPLVPYLWPYLAQGCGPTRILDVGSGAAPQIGQVHFRWDLDVTFADRFADHYAAIWRAHGLQPAALVERQDMTALTYPAASFDIVHCGNALDHCGDPFRAVQEMARVCRPGGTVYLRHLTVQGRLARYSGLHQWNIEQDGSFNRPDPPGNGFALEQCVPGFSVRYFRDITDQGPKVVAILQVPAGG